MREKARERGSEGVRREGGKGKNGNMQWVSFSGIKCTLEQNIIFKEISQICFICICQHRINSSHFLLQHKSVRNFRDLQFFFLSKLMHDYMFLLQDF